MDKIEKMFLDLNSVLVKFWIEQSRPDKETKIALLERMLNWYKKMGYVTPDAISEEPTCLYDGEAPSKQKCGDCTVACSVRVEEEPDKSLEEAADSAAIKAFPEKKSYSTVVDRVVDYNAIDRKNYRDGFIAGAEWGAEHAKNEEEL